MIDHDFRSCHSEDPAKPETWESNLNKIATATSWLRNDRKCETCIDEKNNCC